MSEQKGIKETLELLEALRLFVKLGDDVLEDGKVSLADLPAVLSFLQNVDKIIAGAKGAKSVIGEAKDYDEAELVQIVGKLFEIINEVKD